MHTALPQQRQQRWRKWCSPAVLRSAAAAQCPAFVANVCRGWRVSSPQRKRFCTLLLPRPRARKTAGCAMPSMPQTCKESAPCVPSTSGVGIARQRCDERHRQPRASDSPKGARPRATAPEHCNGKGIRDRPSVAKVAVRRGVRWKRERCCFCCAID